MKAIILFVFTITLSCATIPEATTVGESALPVSEKSYLYGRFYQSEVYYVHVGIILKNISTKEEYRIPFKADTFYVIKVQPVYAIELPSGEYHIKYFYMIKGNAFGPIIVKREPGTRLAEKTFSLTSGKAQYIGDYIGKSNAVFYNSYRWEAMFDRNNYEKTTFEFRKLYPKFDGIETVNGLGKVQETASSE